jgi:hypothetical protein
MLASLLWVFLLSFALVHHRARGLWLLIGAPLALYLPSFWVLGLACAVIDPGNCV